MEKLNNFQFYQPANINDCKVVKENFIIRIKEFELIRYDLENDPMKESVQHYLILGRRGSGKSTLLKRIECEIKTVDSLRQRYEVINFAEEQGSIHRLFDLFEEIIKVLNDSGYDGLPDTESLKIPDNYAEYARELYGFIQKSIRGKNIKLVLLIDNIDKVFLNIKEDAQIFREILLNYDDLKIIGGSTRMSEHFWQYDLPFYQFFRVLRLEALTTPEIKSLLLKWSEILENKEIEEFIKSKPGQIEAIRILTDGLPRTLQFFIDLLVNRPQQNGFEYIRRIMDIITPLYQERLHSLTPIEQKIVMKLAFAWEAIATKDLVQPTKIESKLLSANLKQLANNGIVDIVQTSKKNHLYRLSERFFNMWLIVTQGNPAEKRKAKWLTIFLESWYNKKELKQIVKQHIIGLESGALKADHAVVMTKALAQSRYIGFDVRDNMIERSHRLIGENSAMEQELPEKSIEILKKINSLIEQQNFKQALIEVKSISNEEDGTKEMIIGFVQSMAQEPDEAKRYFKKSTAKGENDSNYLLALLYDNQGKFEIAEKYYIMAIENGDEKAIFNLAFLYDKQGKFELAEEYYLKAIEKGEEDALTNICFLYYLIIKDRDKLSTYYPLIKKNSPNEQQLVILSEIWNGVFTNTKEDIEKLRGEENGFDQMFLIHLLVHFQKNIVWELFNKPETGQHLKDKFLPVYYATASLIETEESLQLLLKMPPEIEETVKDILSEIEKLRKEYYPAIN